MRPEDVLGLLAAVVADVEEHEGVALARQVVHRPPQRLLAARREVHRHADPPLRHGSPLSLRARPWYWFGFVVAVCFSGDAPAARGQLDVRTLARAPCQMSRAMERVVTRKQSFFFFDNTRKQSWAVVFRYNEPRGAGPRRSRAACQSAKHETSIRMG